MQIRAHNKKVIMYTQAIYMKMWNSAVINSPNDIQMINLILPEAPNINLWSPAPGKLKDLIIAIYYMKQVPQLRQNEIFSCELSFFDIIPTSEIITI